MLATLTSKGQVTLPKPIRDELQLGPGIKIDFTVQPDGTLSARPLKASVSSIIGLLHKPGRPPASVAQMNDAVGSYLAAKHERILGTGSSEASALPAVKGKRRR